MLVRLAALLVLLAAPAAATETIFPPGSRIGGPSIDTDNAAPSRLGRTGRGAQRHLHPGDPEVRPGSSRVAFT